MERQQVGQYERLIVGIEEKIREMSRKKRDRRGRSEGAEKRHQFNTESTVPKSRRAEGSFRENREERGGWQGGPGAEQVTVDSQEIVSIIMPFVIEFVKEYLQSFKVGFMGEMKSYVNMNASNHQQKTSRNTARTSSALGGDPSGSDIKDYTTQHIPVSSGGKQLEGGSINSLVYKIGQLEQTVVGNNNSASTSTKLPAD